MVFFRKLHGRAAGFGAVERIVEAERLSPLCIVETGTLRGDDKGSQRGDGWSTVFFRKLIDRVGGELYSVDIDPACIETSRRVIEREFGNLRNTHHVTQDSAAFLRSFDKTIDLLYLDSLDASTDESAARHQRAEIEAALPKVNPRGLILLDDIFGSIETGKAALSVPYLRDHGWTDLQLIRVGERKRRHQAFQALVRRSRETADKRG